MSRATRQISASQVSISGTAAQVVAARPGRSKLYLNSSAPSATFYGPDSTVTTSTGFAGIGLLPTSQGSAELETQAEVWAITSGSSAVVQVLELHD